MRQRRMLLALIALLGLGSILGCSCTCSGLPELLVGLKERALSAVVTPTFTPTFTPTPTDTPTTTPTATPTATATDTPLPTSTPTDTPAPTDTPQPTDTPRPTRPPAPPPPPPTDTPPPPAAEPAVGAHGVQGVLELRDGRADYGVGEDIWFKFTVTNQTQTTITYGILGVAASTGQFQSSWSGNLHLNGGDSLNWEDRIALNTPGTHTLQLSMCFSSVSDCQGAGGDWENLGAPVTVNVR